MSRITDLLAPAEPLPAVPAPGQWTCLYCGTPCPPRGWRGCCTPQCASLEHDAEPADRED